MAPKTDVTAKCPKCGGEGVLPAARYTETPSVCDACEGAGVVAKQDAKKIAADGGE